jgi:hypothetical protein
MGMRVVIAASWVVLIISAGRAAAIEPPPPADELLRLVPPDATVVLTIEGLRDRARTLSESRLASDVWRLPAVRTWLASEKYRRWEQSRGQIEAVLGVKLAEVRDELLGDAVVLVLRLPPNLPPDPSQARGLLLLRARDPALLQRLISAINTAQQENGELARVGDRTRAGTSYHVREFPAGAGRLPEWYATYPDGTFAFSNSETLIQAVVDRKGRAPAGRGGSADGAVAKDGAGASLTTDSGLGDLQKFQAVQRRLPAGALARLFVDPRPIERLLVSSARPHKPADAHVAAMVERYLAGVDYAGAALVWGSDSIVLHSVETLDPSRVDSWLRRWAGNSHAGNPAMRRVPQSALALVAVHLDLPALRDAVLQIVPQEDQERIRNLETVLTGLLLGQDLGTRILPCLGPGVVAYLDAPAEWTQAGTGSAPPGGRAGLFPLVVVLNLAEDQAGIRPMGEPRRRSTASEPPRVTVAAALDNALRTLLALTALDTKHGQGRSRIATREVAGTAVMTLDTPIPFAYALDQKNSRLVLGTSAGAVARYLEMSDDFQAGERFRLFQAAAFPQTETFVCVDLDVSTRLAGHYRDRLASNLAAGQKRPVADVEGDLDHVLAMAQLFRAAFLAGRIEPDATAMHQALGVILHDANAASSSRP